MKIKKLKIKPWVRYFIFIILISIFLFSTFKITCWIINGIKTKDLIKNIEDETIIIETDGNDTENINPPEEKTSDYWKFITENFISVDFNTLISRNSDTVAWIQVNNTNINYPIVKTSDNIFYLTHAFDKSYNDAGWIFMDYRNNSNFDNTNTIIYGHSMKNKTMFGTLLKVKNSSWYTDQNNQIIKVSTPEENTLWQIFSIYTIKDESYYITVDFSSENNTQKFFDTLISRSIYNFNTSLNSNDKIITLSTCNTSDGSERLVVHAKLIKREIR